MDTHFWLWIWLWYWATFRRTNKKQSRQIGTTDDDAPMLDTPGVREHLDSEQHQPEHSAIKNQIRVGSVEDPDVGQFALERKRQDYKTKHQRKNVYHRRH